MSQSFNVSKKQTEILAAVCQILADPSRRQFSLTDLAHAMHVSRAAPYRHFESKTQVCLALIGWCRTSVDSMFVEIERETGMEMHEKVLSKVHALLLFAQKNPGIVRILTSEALEDEACRSELNQLWAHIHACMRASVVMIREYERSPLAGSEDAIAMLAVDFIRGAYWRFSSEGFEADVLAGFPAFADLLVHTLSRK